MFLSKFGQTHQLGGRVVSDVKNLWLIRSLVGVAVFSGSVPVEVGAEQKERKRGQTDSAAPPRRQPPSSFMIHIRPGNTPQENQVLRSLLKNQ